MGAGGNCVSKKYKVRAQVLSSAWVRSPLLHRGDFRNFRKPWKVPHRLPSTALVCSCQRSSWKVLGVPGWRWRVVVPLAWREGPQRGTAGLWARPMGHCPGTGSRRHNEEKRKPQPGSFLEAMPSASPCSYSPEPHRTLGVVRSVAGMG